MGRVPGLIQQRHEFGMQFVRVNKCMVSKLRPLQVIPELFDWVQFRSIGRQSHILNTRRANLLGSGVMRFPSIPDDNNPTTNVIEKVPQEYGDLLGLKVTVLKCTKIEADSLPTRREGERCQHRYFLSTATTNFEDGRLPARSEGPPDQRIQQDAAFVDVDNGGPLAACPF